jgi:hypothetical protein
MTYPTAAQIKEAAPELLNGAITAYIEIRPEMTELEVLREMKKKESVWRAVTSLAVMALAIN